MLTASIPSADYADLSSSIKLTLTSHRLSERRCQVRFLARCKDNPTPTKGHMLVDPQLSLREVSEIIRQRISMMQQQGAKRHSSFYCISGRENNGGFIFFEA
jgi:hypothetical protein